MNRNRGFSRTLMFPESSIGLAAAMASLAVGAQLRRRDPARTEAPDGEYLAGLEAPRSAETAEAIRRQAQELQGKLVTGKVVAFAHTDNVLARDKRLAAVVWLESHSFSAIILAEDLLGAGLEQRRKRLRGLKVGDPITATLMRSWDSTTTENKVTVVLSEREAGLNRLRAHAVGERKVKTWSGANVSAVDEDKAVEGYWILLDQEFAGWLPIGKMGSLKKKLAPQQSVRVLVEKVEEGVIYLTRIGL